MSPLFVLIKKPVYELLIAICSCYCKEAI